ncbi:MAG: hypothetical protein LLF97_01355 [Planctomycetaceae bacterium]|nr:hypothetical protein [Planctomycetaceae bacterium]
MADLLLPTRFLFRFSTACRYRDPLWTVRGEGLDESYRLPSLPQLDGQTPWADLRAAWSEAGLAFWVRVSGKQQTVWCRAGRPEDSDGLQVWIDTRDVHNVHRASRFCHRFVFLPEKGGLADALPINRAKEPPQPATKNSLQVRFQAAADGYRLEALISAEALTGFDPAEHPSLGFTYAVLDREFGEQTLTVGRPMPYQEDPSLWATLELKRP